MKFKRKLLFVTAIASIAAIAPFSTFVLNEQPQKKNTSIKTMDTVYNNVLLFHKQGNIFEIFNEDKLRIKKFNVNKKDIYPRNV